MKITIEVSSTDYARLKGIARDNAIPTVEALLSRKVDYLLYLHRDRATKRKMLRTCSRCKTLNRPDIGAKRDRARACCENCGKKLTATGDPFVPGSVTRLSSAVGALFSVLEPAKVAS